MREIFLQYYQSPKYGQLQLKEINVQNDKEIRSGTVVCSASGEEFTVANGALYLISSDDINDFLKNDQLTVNTFNRQIDEQRENNTISMEFLKSEKDYLDETRARTDFLFTCLNYHDVANRSVLELGAGDTNLIQQFEEIGFNCFALDFADYRICKDSDEYIARGGSYFERVIGLMNKLPFQDHIFDIVISHASLHHATPFKKGDFEWFNPYNMLDTLLEIKRVLKLHEDGGIFIAAGEGVYPDNILPQDRQLELAAMRGGSYEAHYTMAEYVMLFKKAGLFPLFFSNAIEGNLILDTYFQDGTKVELIKYQNYITKDKLLFFPLGCHKNGKSVDLRKLFPEWISLKDYNYCKNGHLSLPLMIDFTEKYPDILFFGFCGIEPKGRWTEGCEASIIFDKKLPSSFKMQIDAYAFGPNIGQKVTFSINSSRKELIFTDKTQSYFIDFENVPASCEIKITVPNCVSPKELHFSEDTRKIGVFLSKIIIFS